jgi:hypothetical protein
VDHSKQERDARLAELRADSLFKKRVTCSHFLEKMPGSATGPDIKFSKGDPLTFKPLVFYNTALNTCISISRSATTKEGVHHTFYDVSDLLTGRSLEWKDIDTSTQPGIDESNKYDDEIQEKYSK